MPEIKKKQGVSLYQNSKSASKNGIRILNKKIKVFIFQLPSILSELILSDIDEKDFFVKDLDEERLYFFIDTVEKIEMIV